MTQEIMSELTIRTSNRPYYLECAADHPIVWKREFDYIDEEDAFSPRLVNYLGVWYDVAAASGANFHGSPFTGWNSYISDSFFSGVLFRYVPDSDFDQVYCATYFS